MAMSLAERTRDAVRSEPFLYDALRAGVVNYSATAQWLDVDGDEDAIATALRRYAGELPDLEHTDCDCQIRMQNNVTLVEGEATTAKPLFTIDGRSLVQGGDLCALVAYGAVDARALAHALDRVGLADIDVEAAGVGADRLLLVVPDRDGGTALQVVEEALDTVTR
jgi:hypothetical protein